MGWRRSRIPPAAAPFPTEQSSRTGTQASQEAALKLLATTAKNAPEIALLDRWDSSALHYAAVWGYPRTTKRLLALGARAHECRCADAEVRMRASARQCIAQARAHTEGRAVVRHLLGLVVSTQAEALQEELGQVREQAEGASAEAAIAKLSAKKAGEAEVAKAIAAYEQQKARAVGK